MAIIPEDSFVGKITPANENYPLGQAKNVSGPGAGDGTPWIADLVNDLFGFQQALLKSAGLTASGNPDTALESQYLQAIQEIISKIITDNQPAYRVRAHARFRWAGSQIVIVNNDGIQSITRTATGQYEIQLATAAPNANYEVYPSGTWGGVQGGASINLDPSFTQTNTRFKLRCDWGGDNLPGAYDPSIINVQVWW